MEGIGKNEFSLQVFHTIFNKKKMLVKLPSTPRGGRLAKISYSCRFHAIHQNCFSELALHPQSMGPVNNEFPVQTWTFYVMPITNFSKLTKIWLANTGLFTDVDTLCNFQQNGLVN